MFFLFAQSPGGIAGAANDIANEASQRGIHPIVIGVGLACIVAIVVALIKIKRDS